MRVYSKKTRTRVLDLGKTDKLDLLWQRRGSSPPSSAFFCFYPLLSCASESNSCTTKSSSHATKSSFFTVFNRVVCACNPSPALPPAVPPGCWLAERCFRGAFLRLSGFSAHPCRLGSAYGPKRRSDPPRSASARFSAHLIVLFGILHAILDATDY